VLSWEGSGRTRRWIEPRDTASVMAFPPEAE